MRKLRYVSGSYGLAEEIANRLRLDVPGDTSMQISHETIYQSLYVQGRSELPREQRDLFSSYTYQMIMVLKQLKRQCERPSQPCHANSCEVLPVIKEVRWPDTLN